MPKKLDLTVALQKLRTFAKKAGRAPSFDEIKDLFGYKSKNAAFWLINQLLDKGVLKKDAKGKLLLAGANDLRVLGSIQAGFPTAAEEQHLDTLNLDDYLVRQPEQSFLVKVSGDSMMDAGIREGDLVLVDRSKQAKSGDIVAAQADGAWTLKTFEKGPKGAVLKPANKKYPVIRPREELLIGGVVTAVIRKYS